MLIYWGMFIIPAMVAFSESAASRVRRNVGPLSAIVFVVWFIMAFRETGGDYSTYLNMFYMIDGESLSTAVSLSDPAYALLNWCSAELGWGLYGVNAVCAVIFLTGLLLFARDEPRPLLVLTIAMSYLVIVVAIGYTRQGTAVGLILWAITHIRRGHPVRAFIYIFVAALFHSTAAAALPLIYFAVQTRDAVVLWALRIGLILSSIYAAWLLLGDRTDEFYSTYITSDHYSSSGALVRSVMNGAAAVIFLTYRRRWNAAFDDGGIWLVFAILALVSVPLSIGGSTAIDRMGLYLIPLQLVAFGRLPTLMAGGRSQGVAVGLVVASYAVALFVWMNLGNFAAELWLPYRSALFGTVY